MPDTSIPPLDSLLAHRRWVEGVARRLLRDEQAAEDLAQEAWIRAMRSPPDPERDPKPWLRRVLKNLASNARRGEGRRQKRETAWRASREPRSPEALVAEAEQHKRLVNLVMDLEETFKTALVLRFYEGLSPREIAELLDVPVGTVHSRISRGVERLKARLDEEEHGDRRAWIAALLPLTGLDRLAPVAASATATTATTATTLLGILVMTCTKPKIALICALALGVVVGGGMWLAADGRVDDHDVAVPPDLRTADAGPTLEGRRGALRADAAAASETGLARTPASGSPTRMPHTVRGAVVDAGGHPVSGAEVFALPESSPGLDDDAFGDPRYGRTRTASDGTFELHHGEMASTRLVAFAAGHTVGSLLLDETPRGAPVEIVLGEPWRLRVRVEDAEGRWPTGCEVDIYDESDDVLDLAIDPGRQAFALDLDAPESGNTHDVALHRTGSVRLFAYTPRRMVAVPRLARVAHPTEEVTFRLLRSAHLTVRLLDASTGEPIGDDVRVAGWMGRRADGTTAWSFGARGPVQRQDTNIAPQTFDLEFEVAGFETWKDTITFRGEGEARTLDVRLEPRRIDVDEGRLFLEVSADTTSSEELLALARLDGEVSSPTDACEMFARMSGGDLEAWRGVWGVRGGWADLHQIRREDGSIEIRQALYPLSDAQMPIGTYDLVVTERGTGRACFVSGIRVFGDKVNRYQVRLEPGTMFAVTDVLPKDEIVTSFEVRTAETGPLPLITLRHNGSQTFNAPKNLEYLLRVPRKPLRLGPFPTAAVEVVTVDEKGVVQTATVRGAGSVVR